MASKWVAFNYSSGAKVLVNVDLVRKVERYTYDGANGTKLFFGGYENDDVVVVADTFENVISLLGAALPSI